MIRVLVLCWGLWAWAGAPAASTYEAAKAWGALAGARAGDSVSLVGYTVHFEKGSKDFYFARYPLDSVHASITPKVITLLIHAKSAPKIARDGKLEVAGSLKASSDPEALFELEAKSVKVLKKH